MNERELLTNGLAQILPQVCPQVVDKFLDFSALLLEKNKVMNLTAVTEPSEVISRHFLDCAMVAPHMISGEKVVDVGTGAGFPGLPLAILCPETEFILLDALHKRVVFLQEAIAALGLDNVTAVHARAEEYAKTHRATFDKAVSRAVANLRVLSELTLPLVRTGGAFLAMKAEGCADEVADAQTAIDILGGSPAMIHRYMVPVSGIARALVEIRKLRETPEKYPRRFARIRAAPLGGK